MSESLRKEILAELDDAWLNISKDEVLLQPLDLLNVEEPSDYYKRFTWLCTQPDYISFVCKAILNLDILPFQALILKELWNRKFPMFIGSRGLSKTWLLSVHSILRTILIPERKIIIAGSAFRQAKILHDYMDKIWQNAPILRDMADQKDGPKASVDQCNFRFGGGYARSIPVGDGHSIRGQRANDIIADEFQSQIIDIFENVIAGFGVVSASPFDNVKLQAKLSKLKQLKEQYGEEVINDIMATIEVEQTYGGIPNQVVISGTAYYDFNHFAKYWKRWKQIIQSKGDKRKISEIFSGDSIPEGFDWRDYSVIRIPIELAPKGLMEEANIARAKATIHSGIYNMEYCACLHPETLIITKKGVRKIIDIEIGDEVFTHKGRFKKVTKKTFQIKNGELYRIDSYGCFHDLLLTSNHPLYIGNNSFADINQIEISQLKTPRLVELNNNTEISVKDYTNNYVAINGYIYPKSSQNIMSMDQINTIIALNRCRETYSDIAKKTRTNYYQVYNLVNYKKPKNAVYDQLKLDYDLGICFGYYVSEGSLIKRRGISFALDGHVDDNLMNLVSQLETSIYRSFGFLPMKYNKDNVVEVSLHSRIIYDLFQQLCPGICYTKLLKHDILFSNKDFMRGYVIGLFNGDGHKTANLATIQLTNLDILVQLKLVLGYFGIAVKLYKVNTSNTKIFGREYNRADTYKVDITGQSLKKFFAEFYPEFKNNYSFGQSQWVYCDEHDMIADIKHITPEPYDNYVYNLEVAEDQSYSTINGTVHNCFTTDSRGFFKRSLIESCVTSDNNPVITRLGEQLFDPVLKGDKTKQYIMAIDPASEVDNFAILILELNEDHNRIVYCWTTNRKKHTERISQGLINENNFYAYCAYKIRELLRKFNVVRISMDSQGGGVTIGEFLHDPNYMEPYEKPIWPIILEKKEKQTDFNSGDHILELCNFAKYEWLREANHGLRKAFEDKELIFPRFDPILIALSINEDAISHRSIDTMEDNIMEIEELKNELCIIELSQTTSGRDRWDVPEVKIGIGKKQRMRKDRYSTLLMAQAAAKNFQVKPLELEFVYGDVAGNTSVAENPGYIGPSWWTDNIKGVY